MGAATRTAILCGDVEQVWSGVAAGDWLGDNAHLHPLRGADGWVRDGDELRHLVVEDVRDGERLVFRWWSLTPDGVGPPSRVELGLEAGDDEDTTVLRVIETPVAPATPVPTMSGPVALATV